VKFIGAVHVALAVVVNFLQLERKMYKSNNFVFLFCDGDKVFNFLIQTVEFKHKI